MKKTAVLDLCLCGAMIALHIILEVFLTIRIGNSIKITFATLPFIIIALLCGPIEGLVTGLLGTFLSQLITFGITPTTAIWIIPGTVCGLTAGLIYKAFKRRPDVGPIAASVSIAMLVFVVLNWIASYFDGVVIYKYMTIEALFALIPMRLLIGALLAVVYIIVAIPLCKALQGRIKRA